MISRIFVPRPKKNMKKRQRNNNTFDLKRKPLLLAYPADIKMVGWARALEKYDISICLFTSAFRYLQKVFGSWIRRTPRGKPIFLVHRYIGDYPSHILALFGLVFTCALCFFSLFRSVHLLWFLHDVDKDTVCYHPIINKLRRFLLAKYSCSIFVIDPLLIRHAEQHIPPRYQHKLRWTCFGVYEPSGDFKTKHSIQTDPKFLDNLEKFLSRRSLEVERGRKKHLIGLCLTNVAAKYKHIHLAPRLIEEAEQNGIFSISLIIAGSFEQKACFAPNVIEKIRKNAQIFLWANEVAFDEIKMRDLFDFIWRINDDFSVPLTAYVASTCKAPLLTLRTGFLPELVDSFNLGAVLENDFSNVDDCLVAISGLGVSNFHSKFLSSRNWDAGAEQIWNVIKMNS